MIIIITEVARKLVNSLTHHMICVSPTNGCPLVDSHLVQCAFVASISSAQYMSVFSAVFCYTMQAAEMFTEEQVAAIGGRKAVEDAKKVRD